MTLLRLEQLQLAYGTQVLLNRADLTVEKGERLALVGRNGTGKSTLLKLVAGDIQADDGTIWRAPGLKIGVLSQELPASSGMTIFDMVAQGLPEAGELLSEYQHLVHDPDPDMDRMAKLQTRIEAIDGWSFHQSIDVVLTRLGLPPEAEMSALSGGWRRRVALARALVSEPDLLLLDEPTNHLDLDTIAWLEEQLLAFNGAVLLITHDRAFLSKLATNILELHTAFGRGKLTQQNFQKRGLTRSITAKESNTITAHHFKIDITKNGFLTKIVCHAFQLDNPLTSALTAINSQVGGTLALTALTALDTHLFEFSDASFVTGAACFNTLTNPDLFLRQFFVKKRILARLNFQLVLLTFLVLSVFPGITA